VLLTANECSAPYRSSKRGLSSFSANGMVLLLLLFGRVTLQTGQRAPKWAHGDTNIHKGDKRGGPHGGRIRRFAPAMATPLQVTCIRT